MVGSTADELHIALTSVGLLESSRALRRSGAAFPNRLIEAGLRKEIPKSKDLCETRLKSIDGIRSIFEAGLKDTTLVKKANNTLHYFTLQASERVAVRRMMSRYWGNSSPFALDLVGAVIRQGSFIQKMHSIDWLHSPALAATMARLITKYLRYFQIIAAHPKQLAVPTLDVDLAWYI